MARLAAYDLLAAATQTTRRHQVYLVIDEFQRMIARNLEYMLQLARSMGVGVIIANQSMQDLKKSSMDLITPIESNCRYRQWFSVSSAEDRERLVKSSGETVDLLVSRSRLHELERRFVEFGELPRARYDTTDDDGYFARQRPSKTKHRPHLSRRRVRPVWRHAIHPGEQLPHQRAGV